MLYYIQLIWYGLRRIVIKPESKEHEIKNLLNDALLLKKDGDNAFDSKQYKNALLLYSKRLNILNQIPNTQDIISKHIRNQKTITLYDICAVYIKLNDWNNCMRECTDNLDNDPTTRKLFEMFHNKLSINEIKQLLHLLNEDYSCHQFNDCYFNFAAIKYFCEQNGKCCAAATIAGGLNVILKESRLNTEDGLNTFIHLYPKYAKKLLVRSTKNIGNVNLKTGMKYLAKHELNMKIAIKTLISGSKCKCKGIYVITKEELELGSLNKYQQFLKWYLQQDNNVLLAHIKNHYCLVFGMRKNNHKTEILLAKKGQDPKDWVSLHDLLSLFARSKQYKLFVVTKRD